jgi:hypothetical protein
MVISEQAERPVQNESAFDKKIEEQTAASAFQLVWGWIEKLGNKAWEKKAVHAAMKTYARMYRERHGAVKVLGMSRPAPLHQVYTSVRVVPRDFLGAFTDIDEMHAAFKDGGRVQPAFRAKTAEDGIKVANDEAFLNVLGAPGAGKSTFVRRLGLEALLAGTPTAQADLRMAQLLSKYQHARLPVYLELRGFRNKPVDLIALMSDEFATCQFPESRSFVEAALEGDKLLVLLDGLDEVPNDKLNEVIDHVRQFVDRYGTGGKDGNRFVTSCRTAHYKNAFPRFVDVVLADFSDEQIAQFVTNWFCGQPGQGNELAEKFVATLKQPANAGALELARTPLLLTFLCITYDHGQELPPTRATLYRRALDLLLREWAAERRVHDDQVYQELNAELELDMLAELADSLFREDRFFFNRQRVTDHIRAFLGRELKAPRSLDTVKILEAIEVQQGLIVRRAQDAYSFSHLTIQEYLTARKLWEAGEAEWRQAVNDHAFDTRWNVVFVLMAGMGKADELIRAIAARGRTALSQATTEGEDVLLLLQWIAANIAERPGVSPQDAATGRFLGLALACVCDTPHNLVHFNDGALLQASRDAAAMYAIRRNPDVVFSVVLHFTTLLGRARVSAPGGESAGVEGRFGDVDIAHVLARQILATLHRCSFLVTEPAGLATMLRVLERPDADVRIVNRALRLPELGPDRSARWPAYLGNVDLLFQCKKAAYRLSTEAWDDVCHTILRLPAKP